LINLTNDTFSEMGVTTSYGKKPAASNKKLDVCGGCKKEIMGQALGALDNTWHPDCFQCSQCSRPIEVAQGGSYIVRGNKAWCKKCDDWDRKEGKNKKAAATSPSTGVKSGTAGSSAVASGSTSASPSTAAKNAAIAKKNQEQLEAHDNIQAGKELCASCHKPIMGEAVDYKSGTADQEYYHVACFICQHCRKPVDNSAEGFQHYKEKIYHPACYQLVVGHGICGGCGQNITTKYVQPEVGGTKFHSACCVCSVAGCKTPLAAGFAVRDGKAYCASCANAKFSTSTTITGQKMTGFKLDPKTHQKIATSTFTQAPIHAQPAKTTVTVTTGTGADAQTTVKKNFCSGCGAPASSGGRFCGTCGARL